jgi:murein L,D-transpeptidase YcbB/YkuD
MKRLWLCAWLVALAWPALGRETNLAAPAPLTLGEARAIAQAATKARAEGLPAADLAAAVRQVESPDPAARALADAALSAAAVALAAAEHGMRIDPQSADSDFHLLTPYDAVADFAAARTAGQVESWAARLAPTTSAYADLVKARALYASIVAAGGWPSVPKGKTMKPGAVDPRAPLLRQRLATEGYQAAAGADPNLFDPALAQALKAFQSSHGLKPDGVLSPATTAALNDPAEDRLAAIDANLERERWLPARLPASRIEVDVANPTATYYSDGAPPLTMRAIVGNLRRHTPAFASKVTAIQFNPPWIVPADIAAPELYPKERRHPGYFARNDFSVKNGQLVQRPGPKAALGYIKFVVPDPFQIYLHDTPARSLFARDNRWLSHGCVRLELPRDLAAALLAGQGWRRDDVDAAIASGKTTTIPLKAQPAVFIVYRTVVADADGHATFLPDVYGWDAKLAAALQRSSSSPAV